MKRSIKRKIQNSMFLANILTLLTTTVILIPIIHVAYGPVTQYVTRSIAYDFQKTYEAVVSHNSMKNAGNSPFMESESLDAVISNINHLITEEENLPIEMAMELNDTSQLKIVATSAGDYKRIVVLSKDIFDKSRIKPINTSLIEMDIVILDKKMINPIDRSYYDEWGFKPDISSENKIQIVDANDVNIGYIVIRMDPRVFPNVNVAFIVIIIALSLFSIFIVKMVSKILTQGIMRPIHQVNKQLSLMADNEIDEASNFILTLKKPPVEIETMIKNSNEIMNKFKQFNSLLENQNEELHMQNEELVHNRLVIETQQNQLIQSEKMASVGQISAAVVHEINTPIGAIKSNAQIIDMLITQLSHEEDPEKFKKKINLLKPTNDVIISASDRVIQIVKSIKNFSRIDQSAFKEADLHEAIDSVLLLTSNMWKSRITLTKEYGQLPFVNCYIGLINQVIMNLVVNAIDSIESVGEIKIVTGVKEEEAFISVIDTGAGISPENLSQIFVHGFTTKPIGKGSGLGLALSKDIMDKHMGRISVDSTLDKGSAFTIWIPLKAPHKSL